MVATNYFKTGILLALMTGLVLGFGYLLGGQQGVIIAMLFAGVMNFVSYWFSDKIVLKMYRAQPVTPQQAPDLHEMVDGLCARSGLPKPALYILPQQQPNAFATGRNPKHSAVAVTQGLLELMNREEVEGVVAHELAHIKNRDMLISTVAATFAGAIGMLATMVRWGAIFGGYGRDERGGGGNLLGALALSIVAPMMAVLIQMAVSRSREFGADAVGAQIAGNPYGLANALKKLGQYSQRIPMREASPATSHLFIVMPMLGGMGKLFSTHPPIEERVRRLVGNG